MAAAAGGNKREARTGRGPGGLIMINWWIKSAQVGARELAIARTSDLADPAT